MSVIEANPEWSAVPQIEVGDRVRGGKDGPANKQAQALANRTEIIKSAVLSYPDYATAAAAATGLPDGQLVQAGGIDYTVAGQALIAERPSASVSEVNTIGQLRALPAPKKKCTALVRGHSAENDGGGGVFLWVPASTKTDNGGTVICPVSTPSNGRWEREYSVIHAEMFGVFGSGADETTRLTALLSAAAGKTVIFGDAKTYLFNPTSPLIFQANTKAITNGSKFKETTNNTQYVIVVNDGVEVDYLALETIGTSNAQYVERGIYIPGSNVSIGKINVTSLSYRTGANNQTYNAVRIGPETGSASNVYIGHIEISGWEFPFVIQNLNDWTIDRVKVDTYKRAGYIKDCKRGTIYAGHVKGINAAASTGRAGENGLLLESTSGHYSTENIRVYNYDVEDAGEHGIRLGGQKSMRNIWLTNCSSRNHGAGYGTESGANDDDHGGCGFKVLGPTSVYGARHEAIYLVDCIAYEGHVDDGPSEPWRPNFAGFQMAKCRDSFLVNPTVKPSVSTSSYAPPSTAVCINGIEVLGCENMNIINPQVSGYRNSGIMFYDAQNTVGIDWGIQTDVKVTGGNLSNAGIVSKCNIAIRCQFTAMRRVTIDGVLCDSGENAIKVEKSGSGALIGCSTNITAWNHTVETFSGTEDFLINARGQFVGENACRAGSTLTDLGNNRLQVRESSDWGNPPTTFSLTVASGSVASFTPKNSAQIIAFSSQASASIGLAWIRTSSAASIKLAGASTFAVTNTDLTGTTGAEGNLTVSGFGGVVKVENRTVNAITLRVTQFG